MYDSKDILALATNNIVGSTLQDLGALMGLANLRFGLAKVLWAQQQLGLTPDATFHTSPDFAITRNRTRWGAGFAYGGLLSWSGPFAILDLKPNACGMLVGALQSPQNSDELDRRLAAFGNTVVVEGVETQWDFDSSNHFFQLYRADWKGHSDFADFDNLFLLHGSGDEHRRFLYHDRHDFVFAQRARIISTPWGDLKILLERHAEEFFAAYQRAQSFALARREAFANAILGPDIVVVTHPVHQGLAKPGAMLLGSHLPSPGALYPFAQQERLPAYLLTTTDTDPSHSAAPLPHGSGYRIPLDFTSVEVSGEHDSERIVTLHNLESGERTTVDDIRALPFAYRGQETLQLATSKGLASIAAELTPLLRISQQGTRQISQS